MVNRIGDKNFSNLINYAPTVIYYTIAVGISYFVISKLASMGCDLYQRYTPPQPLLERRVTLQQQQNDLDEIQGEEEVEEEEEVEGKKEIEREKKTVAVTRLIKELQEIAKKKNRDPSNRKKGRKNGYSIYSLPLEAATKGKRILRQIQANITEVKPSECENLLKIAQFFTIKHYADKKLWLFDESRELIISFIKNYGIENHFIIDDNSSVDI